MDSWGLPGFAEERELVSGVSSREMITRRATAAPEFARPVPKKSQLGLDATIARGNGTGTAASMLSRARAIILSALACSLAACGTTSSSSAPPAAPTSASSATSAPATINGGVLAVAATSDSNVWAAGCMHLPKCDQTLTEHWNGTAWKQVPSPSPGPRAVLNAVATVSASSAWAVGVTQNSDGSNSKVLILHWNGTRWTQAPSTAPADSQLLSVAATSAENAWAVGYTSTGGANALILHWNGATWTRVPAPAGTSLSSVTAVSARDAWAAGYDILGTTTETLILHWNGMAWTRVPSPDPGNISYVTSVAAASADSAWAAGFSVPGPGAHKAFILRWDGSNWKTVPFPGPADSYQFKGVATASAGTAWAFGCATSKTPGPCASSLLLQWNGAHWTPVRLPPHAEVLGVIPFSATNALAIDGGENGTILQMRWNGKTWK